MQFIVGALGIITLWLAVNWIYQVVRKPSELFFPVSGTLYFAWPGGGASTDDGVPAASAQMTDAVGVAVGPDGEIYYVERSAARVRVVNPGTTDVVVGGTTVAPGTVRTVAGGNGPGFTGDGGLATSAQLQIPSAIDVSAARGMFVADTGNVRVRLVNLGAAPVTYAETTVGVGEIATVAGGGSGGVGSKARDLQFAIPNALCVDANGNLLVADERTVIFVNGAATSITSYGKTAGPARTARPLCRERCRSR